MNSMQSDFKDNSDDHYFNQMYASTACLHRKRNLLAHVG